MTRNPPSRLPTLSAVLSYAANRVIVTGMATSLLSASRVIRSERVAGRSWVGRCLPQVLA